MKLCEVTGDSSFDKMLNKFSQNRKQIPPGAIEEMHRQVEELKYNAANLAVRDKEYADFEGRVATLLAQCIPHFEKSFEDGMRVVEKLEGWADDVSRNVAERIRDILHDET